MFKPRDYQVQIKKDLYKKLNKGAKKVVIVAPTGSGKCLGKDTPILMFDGTIKKVQDVRTGDLLMGDDSTPRTVLSTCQGIEELFKITPIKGEPWVCNRSHILSLVSNDTNCGLKKNQVYDISIEKYLTLNKTQKHILKQYSTGVDFPSQEIDFDPYLLGVWLGDGSENGASISTMKQIHIDLINNYANENNLNVRHYERRYNSHTYFLSDKNRKKNNSFLKFLQSNNLINNKHIPQKFLTNDRVVRLELLAGLIDTDGYIHSNCCEIIQKRKELSEQITFLARSLGYRVVVSEKIVKDTIYYRMSISGDLSDIPLRHMRHEKIEKRRQIKNVLRTGFKVESIGEGEYYGFEIDGNRRFLLGDFTVTHNTVISTDIINDAVSRNRKVLFLIHRDVLAEQTAKTLNRFGLNCGFIMGSKKANPDAQIQVASVQTLARRELDFKPDLIFYDECHLTSYTTIGKKFLTELNDVWHVGLTATPWRLKKTEGLGDLFDDLIHTPLPYELMEMGYLVRPRYFVLEKPDTKGVRITAGDYNLQDLGVVCNQENVINNLVENWLNIAKDRKTIVFAVNVDHAKAIASAFNAQGIASEAVYGDMSIKDREVIYEHLKTGQIKVITSCEALAEGFDVPSIDCVVLARPTKSKAKYFQQVGRGLRISPDKVDCLVLDQAGLVEAFDPIEDLRSYTLETGQKKKACTNFCEKCGRGTLPNLSLCPRCMEKAEKEKILPIGVMRELIVSKGKKREFEWYRKRLQMAYFSGYSPGWAMMKFNDHYGYFPDAKWGINAIFGETPSQKDKDKYIEHLIFIAVKNQKSRKWIERQYLNEFGEYPPKEKLLLVSQLSLDIGDDL